MRENYDELNVVLNGEADEMKDPNKILKAVIDKGYSDRNATSQAQKKSQRNNNNLHFSCKN